jgi:hypothetical protein
MGASFLGIRKMISQKPPELGILSIARLWRIVRKRTICDTELAKVYIAFFLRPRSHALRGNAFWDALRPGVDNLDPSELLVLDAERRGRHSHVERGNEGKWHGACSKKAHRLSEKRRTTMDKPYQARWISKKHMDSLRKTGQLVNSVLLESEKGHIIVEPANSHHGDGGVLAPRRGGL